MTFVLVRCNLIMFMKVTNTIKVCLPLLQKQHDQNKRSQIHLSFQKEIMLLPLFIRPREFVMDTTLGSVQKFSAFCCSRVQITDVIAGHNQSVINSWCYLGYVL
jgi:hypothetical protein